MVLKKAFLASILTLAIGASAAGAVSAASATKASETQAASAVYVVNGSTANISTIEENGIALAALREIAPKLGAKLQIADGGVRAKLNNRVVVMKIGSDAIQVDGAEQKLQVPVRSIKGVTYVELKTFVEALGGQFEKNEQGTTWIDSNLLADVDHIQWVDDSRFIASQETDSGRKDYLVDALTGHSERLRIPEGASELVAAPDGTKAAFTNANGEVFVLDFKAIRPYQASKDTSIKPELVWSADSSSIYFLQGDKGSVIAKLEPETGKIAKILEDKVDYKANLNVSSDGLTFTYTVTKPGVVVADASKPVDADDVAIDMKGTEPQIYQFTVDPGAKENKAVQLTSSSDDKVFVRAAADGSSVSYVSVGTDEAARSTLVTVGKDKKTVTLYNDKDVYDAVQSAGKWYVLTEGADGGLFVYEVDPVTSAAKQLYELNDTVTEIFAKDGAPFAIMDDGRVFVDSNGQWKPVTRK